MRKLTLTLMALWAMTTSACTSSTGTNTVAPTNSGGSGGGSAGTTPITLDNLQTELVKGVCASVAKCGTWTGHFGASGSCEQMFGSDFVNLDKEVSAIKAGKMKFNAAAAQECIAALASVCFGTQGAEPKACQDAFVGLVADGAACDDNDVCASDFCKLEMGKNCGVCAPATKPGDACSEAADDCSSGQNCINGACTAANTVTEGKKCLNDDDCTKGLTCAFGEMDAVCKALAAKGASCQDNDQCADGLTCVYSSFEGPGVCGQAVAAGQPCIPSGGSSKEQCTPGHVCAIATDWDGKSPPDTKCAPLVKVGDACISHLQCGIDSFCNAGKCALLPKSGESCAPPMMAGEGNGRCGLGLYCGPDKQCGAAPGEGKPCPSGECGKGLKCNFQADTPTCYAPLAAGAACTLDSGVNCANGLTCTDGKCAATVCM